MPLEPGLKRNKCEHGLSPSSTASAASAAASQAGPAGSAAASAEFVSRFYSVLQGAVEHQQNTFMRLGANATCQERRAEAIARFLKKRKERNFEKKVRYASRKRLAEARPRVRGQFVRLGNAPCCNMPPAQCACTCLKDDGGGEVSGGDGSGSGDGGSGSGNDAGSGGSNGGSKEQSPRAVGAEDDADER